MSIDHLEPAKVFGYFEKLTQIPHCSYHTKAISDYCVDFAKAHGYKVIQDDCNNVIIIKEASPGYEDAKPVILQGHLDMVCEKTKDSTHDFAKDPLSLIVDGDWLTADRTTLGADNGIAVAICLAILDDDGLSHPKLYVLFTTEEEVGMDGATSLSMSPMSDAAYLINIDSEDEGILTAGCAGGVRSVCTFPINWTKKTNLVCELVVDGLHGGHSGMEIRRFGANASILLGNVLAQLNDSFALDIANITGGKTDNVIPSGASAKILINPEDIEDILAALSSYEEVCKTVYGNREPNLHFQLIPKSETTARVFTSEFKDKVLFILMFIPNGVRAMSHDIDGLVETSLNLGALSTDDTSLTLSFALRSSVEAAKNNLGTQLAHFTQYLGGHYEEYSPYPAWEYHKKSKLRDTMISVSDTLFGKKPTIEVIHAGLECGILYQKLPTLDIVSIGPEMENIHTPEERLNIPSTKRTYDYIVAVLQALK